ncbi:ARPP-1 family domain-containing protein [Microcella flavibacter]|uniref:ARPP-1 family domain-containing protein n=1 Tax=Microcella flavibacter TaxID=1804990 RepID=UPI001456F99E|nr:DUF6569 family protein [Microcella flavibacter]
MNATIPTLHVGHGTHQAGLTLFPVWVDAPRIGSLDWAPSALTVTELDDAGGPRVAGLRAHSTAARPLVALEGDLLEGGWQNRMLGRSLVLHPGETREVEAVCVEEGRWGGGREHGARGRRGSLVVRFGDERARQGATEDRQGGVWRRIRAVEDRLGASETRSFTQQLDRRSIRPPRLIEGQRGVIIGVGGRVIGLELFCSGSGLRSRWEGIVAAAEVDAHLGDPVPTQAERARAFARRLQGRRLHGGDDGASWFELARTDERLDVVGLGARTAGTPSLGLVHLTALDRAHPVLAAV